LNEASIGEHALTEATAAAQTFADGPGFVRAEDAAVHDTRLFEVLDRARNGELDDMDRLVGAVRQLVDETSIDGLAADADRARDSVVAAYLLGDSAPSAEFAQKLVRGHALATAVLSGSATPEQLDAIVRGPMALPDAVLLLRDRAALPPTPPSAERRARELADQINTLATRRQHLTDTLQEVGFHAEDELVLSELGEQTPLSSLYHTLGQLPQPAPGLAASPRVPLEAPAPPLALSPLLRASAGRNVVLSTNAIELLPQHVVQTLTSLQLEPGATTLAEIHNVVAQEHAAVGQQLMELAGQFANVKGSAFADVGPAAHVFDPAWRLDPVDEPDSPAPVSVTPPTTHSAIKALGVADLLLVRTHISHYERGEVAALENVLTHEKLTHTLRRLDTTDTTTTDDTETTDLRSQAQTVADTNSGHTTVQAVGPGVGPVAAEGPSSFAKTVTDQVSSSTSNRTRRLAVQRVLREREETFEHLLDNTAVDATAYGVYQWLDRVYAAQVFNYGSRLLYDIIVPEPAALFREALARPRSGLPLPKRPARFTLAPTSLSIDNWAYYVSGHHASGVDAPPAAEQIVAENFGGRSKDSFSTDAVTNSFVIAETRSTRLPKGYRAARYNVTIQASGYASGYVRVIIGRKFVNINSANGTYVRSGKLDLETETLPVGWLVDSDGVNFGIQTVAVGVEIICERTDELFTAWQVKAHGAILDANQRRFQDYEERVANRDATARIFVQSLSAARKVAITLTEVKRAALSMLTAQNFSGFNLIQNDPLGFPFPAATAGAFSAYIRFFEQAVEWDHLAYAFFPYFWGAQSSWVSKLLSAEGDAQFASFLNSGAARVVLPIRRNYEAAFERFLNTGTTPTTAELLDVGSPLWVTLVDELRQQQAEDGLETPVDEPWQFRIASDLIRARADAKLPKWTLAAGEWHDEADPDS
jgi:hypothetical protein